MLTRESINLLFLHGWGVNNTIWNRLVEQLKDNNSVSMPCLYSVARKTNDHSFISMADSLDASLSDDCVIIAWSMGGLIATYLSEISKNIKAIIFIASAPCFINKADWTNAIESKKLEGLHNNLLHNPRAALETFSGLIAHGDKRNKTTVKHLRENMANKNQTEILSSWLSQLKEIDLRNKFTHLSVPAYLLLGEHDALINSKIERQLRQLNGNVKYNIMKSCGHAPFISKTEDTKKLIEGFLSAEPG